MDSVSFKVKKQVIEQFYYSFVSEKFQSEEGAEDEPKKPFAFLDELTDEQLISMVLPEDTRVKAIVMAQVDPEKRAKVDSYLHLHHRNVREASIGLVAPKVRKDLNFSEDFLITSKSNIEKAFEAIESGWLRDSRFLIGNTMTIADISAYVEIGQLQSMFTNVYNFEPYPNIRKWLKEMQNVDYHDDIHVALYELGDISKEAPPMEIIINANKKAFKVIQEKLINI